MNLRFTFVALCLGLTITPAPAFAVSWVNIGENSSGSVYDVDWDSLRRDGNVVTFTLRVKYGTPAGEGESDGYVAHRKANCSNQSYSDLQTDYMKNDAVLRSSGQEETRTAGSGSIAALVLNKVCAK
jgi:hypothetical protein